MASNDAAGRPPASVEPAPSRAPDQLEVQYAACVVRDRRLIQRDTFRVFDELRTLALRGLVAQLAQGQAPEDVLYDADEQTRKAVEGERLPTEEEALEQAFGSVCRRLKLRFIEDQLGRIARETARAPGGHSDLTDEVRALFEERAQLLKLKREVLAQPS